MGSEIRSCSKFNISKRLQLSEVNGCQDLRQSVLWRLGERLSPLRGAQYAIKVRVRLVLVDLPISNASKWSGKKMIRLTLCVAKAFTVSKSR